MNLWNRINKMQNEYEKIIVDIMLELDKEQADYQQLHRNIYGKTDADAKNIHSHLIRLCERIRKEFDSLERK